MNENARPKHSGKAMLEHTIAVFQEYGYEQLDKSTFKKRSTFQLPLTILEGYANKCFITNEHVYNDIYGTPKKTHIYAYCPVKYKTGLLIEVRWQAISGTVDQKYPFIILSLERAPTKTILILDGKGMREEAVEWAKGRETDKHMVFSSLGEFSRWARTGL